MTKNQQSLTISKNQVNQQLAATREEMRKAVEESKKASSEKVRLSKQVCVKT